MEQKTPEEIIRILTAKDDKQAYAKAKEIAAESEFSDRYYACLDIFARLLQDKKSYIRTRAFILCCSQARWDELREILQETETKRRPADRSGGVSFPKCFVTIDFSS